MNLSGTRPEPRSLSTGPYRESRKWVLIWSLSIRHWFGRSRLGDPVSHHTITHPAGSVPGALRSCFSSFRSPLLRFRALRIFKINLVARAWGPETPPASPAMVLLASGVHALRVVPCGAVVREARRRKHRFSRRVLQKQKALTSDSLSNLCPAALQALILQSAHMEGI